LLRTPGPQLKDVASVMSNTLARAHDQQPPFDRRLHSRQPIRSLTYVELDEGNGGIVLNLSEGGFSVQAVTSLMDEVLPSIRFQLPESEVWVQASARISWTSSSRKEAGLEFINLREDSLKRIREWLVHETLPAGTPGDAGAPSETGMTAAAEAGVANAAIPSFHEGTALTAEPPSEGRRDEQYRVAAPLLGDESTAPVAPVSEPASSTPVESLESGADVGHEVQPTPAIEPNQETPHFAARLFRNKWAMAALAAILAIGSLAAGWAAGEGEFGAFLQRSRRTTGQKVPAERDVATNSASPVARVDEIEIINASNQRWMIPFNGPLNASEDGTRRQTPGRISAQTRNPPTGFRTWILSPPRQTRNTIDNSGTLKDNPPSLPNAAGAAENVLSSSGSINSQSLAGLPALRVPDPGPITGVVKQGHVVRRVDPAYPAIARSHRVEGTVRLNVTVGQDGSVRGVALLGGPPMLVEAAETAVRQWRYSPSTLDGKPVEFRQEVDLRFHAKARFIKPASRYGGVAQTGAESVGRK
jgi:TonB family protein